MYFDWITWVITTAIGAVFGLLFSGVSAKVGDSSIRTIHKTSGEITALGTSTDWQIYFVCMYFA